MNNGFDYTENAKAGLYTRIENAIAPVAVPEHLRGLSLATRVEEIVLRYLALEDDLAAARARIAELEEAAGAICTWREEIQPDWDSSWQSDCGQSTYYADGDCPTDNGYIYCHHCGKRIALLPLPPAQGEEG